MITLSIRIGELLSEADRRTLAWIRERVLAGLPIRDVFLLDAHGREVAPGNRVRADTRSMTHPISAKATIVRLAELPALTGDEVDQGRVVGSVLRARVFGSPPGPRLSLCEGRLRDRTRDSHSP